MIDFIVNLIGLFASFLDALLPDSPFAGLIETMQLMLSASGPAGYTELVMNLHQRKEKNF